MENKASRGIGDKRERGREAEYVRLGKRER